MNTKRIIQLLFIALILLVSVACAQTSPQLTEHPTQTVTKTAAVVDLPPEPTLEPTFTETIKEITDTPTPTEPVSTKLGSIVYVFNEDLWLYNIDTDDNAVFYDGGGKITTPKLSPDDQYLAFYEDGVLNVLSLDNKELINFSEDSSIIKWLEKTYGFFRIVGDGLQKCYEIENIEDQKLFKIEIFREHIDPSEQPELLVSISGGWMELQAISKDGEWASLLHCRCFSECYSHSLWHLPTQTRLSLDLGFTHGAVSFSQDSTKATFSAYYIHEYEERPLYVVDLNNPNPTIIYSQPGLAIDRPAWSPTGNWIVFQAFNYDEMGQKILNRRLMAIQPDGNNPVVIGGENASLLGWSPDGEKVLILYKDQIDNFLYIYDLNDGNNPVVIGKNAALLDWSPDGEKVLIQYKDEIADYLYFYDLNDASETRLPFTVPGPSAVDWGFTQ